MVPEDLSSIIADERGYLSKKLLLDCLIPIKVQRESDLY
jgi:hypothetical protein